LNEPPTAVAGISEFCLSPGNAWVNQMPIAECGLSMGIRNPQITNPQFAVDLGSPEAYVYSY
jgi:hypothetical protein